MDEDNAEDKPETTPAPAPNHEPARLWIAAVTELLIACRNYEQSKSTTATIDLMLKTALQRATRVMREDMVD
jgi:hypothetical protein